MRIRYVVSTMVFWWRQNRLSFEWECQFLKSLGYGIELWPNMGGLNECRYDKHNWARLSAATGDMLVTMRARNDEPTLEQWDEQIQCAKLLDAHIVTDLRSLGLCNDNGVNGQGFAEEVIKLAQANKTTLCLETGPLPTLKQLGEKFESIRYCLDVGYVNLDREYSFKQYVDDLAPSVAHVHLCDNYGCTDDHQPPGLDGGIARENWDYLLQTLNKYDSEVIGSLEVCPSMPDVLIRQASDFLFEKMQWPNQPQQNPDYNAIDYDPAKVNGY